jgi:hypothetical protein
MAYLQSPGNWIVVLTSVVLTSLCVVLHYEVLNLCNRFLSKLSHQRRRRVLLLMFIILSTHVTEIWMFGAGYLILVRGAGLGALTGLPTMGLPDFVYFSAVTYATVGFGDVVPTGAIRFLAGLESLTGFLMITWSASYTFLEMQRDWRPG